MADRTMADRLRLQDFGSGGVEVLPDALILILSTAGDGAEQESALARQWQPIVPRAAFVGIELDAASDATLRQTDLVPLRRAAADAATARLIQPSQIILFGTGKAGRLAVDLVLQGAIPGAGVLGLDISLEPDPSRVLPTAARVRLVQHSMDDDPRATRFHALIEAMQRQAVDVRSMILSDVARASPGVTLRAGGTFLGELVAAASRTPAKPGS